MTVAISGASGFLGWHLKQHLKWIEDCDVIEVGRDFFEGKSATKNLKVDVFVHLAGVNRHEDQEFLYTENIRLAKVLAQKIENEEVMTNKIIYTSSTHEKFDTPYGRSKKEANRLLKNVCDNNKISYTGLVLPNIFGPFAKPNYNTVVATFCHNTFHEIECQINDNKVSLVYVSDVVKHISQCAYGKQTQLLAEEISVRELHTVIQEMHRLHESNEVPIFRRDFERSLYVTYLASRPVSSLCRDIKMHADERGYFSELIVSRGMAQFSFSVSEVGISRGDHFHTYKAEIFFVISGKARLQMRKIGTNEITCFEINANEQPQLVHIPVWHTHSISNTGDDKMLCGFWISHPFRYDSGDTYFEQVNQ